MGTILDSRPRIVLQVLLVGCLFLLGFFHSRWIAPGVSLRSELAAKQSFDVAARLMEDWSMVRTLIGQQEYFEAGLLYSKLKQQLADIGTEAQRQSFAAAWQAYLDEVARELVSRIRKPDGILGVELYYRFASSFSLLDGANLPAPIDPLPDSFIDSGLRATRLVVKSNQSWLANAIRHAVSKQYGTRVMPFLLAPASSSQVPALRTLTVEAKLSKPQPALMALELTFIASGSEHLSTSWDQLESLKVERTISEPCFDDIACVSRVLLGSFPALPQFQVRREVLPKLANRVVDYYLSGAKDFESWFRARMVELEFHHTHKERRRVVKRLLTVVGRKGWPEQAWSVVRVLAESNAYQRETFEALKVLSQRAPQGRQRWLLVNSLAQKSVLLDPEDATVYLPTLIEWITEELDTNNGADSALLHAIRNSLISQYVTLDPLALELRYGILAEISNAYPGDRGLSSAFLEVLCSTKRVAENILRLEALGQFLRRVSSLDSSPNLNACFKRLKGSFGESDKLIRASGVGTTPEAVSKFPPT